MAEETAAGESSFAAAEARTRQALQALSAHWRAVKLPARLRDEGISAGAVADAVDGVLNAPDGLSEKGHAWSLEVGLNYVLPTQALNSRPLGQSVGGDGLLVSTGGGPVQKTHPNLIVAPAPPCGFGVFPTARLRKGEALGEYLGEARTYSVWLNEIKAQKTKQRGKYSNAPFLPEELYAAWTGSGPAGAGVVLDAFHAGNAMRFINCSCNANCSFKDFGAGSQKHGRLRVVALRDIEPWEQLSVDYGWYHDQATHEEIHAQALVAYNADLKALNGLLRGGEGGGYSGAARQDQASASSSAAVRAVAATVAGESLTDPAVAFLQRFLDEEQLGDAFAAGSLVEAFSSVSPLVRPCLALFWVCV
eukprot:TRINITY_DN36928_c0_g1_i4.p1 TRINITY_DN36928_c0_g1~~TRINITY_DN36928_c0_g1_i4.p1  ORF type:complete len:382 (-),score=62.71 TRINITY_DN36928_c0_g1_i4:12-1100(-)